MYSAPGIVLKYWKKENSSLSNLKSGITLKIKTFKIFNDDLNFVLKTEQSAECIFNYVD